MRRFIVFCIISIFLGSVWVNALESEGARSVEGQDDQRYEPVRTISTSEEKAAYFAERKKSVAEYEVRRENLNELERLAVPLHYGTSTREEVLPYRFSDVSRLQFMLRDPVWANEWQTIATTLGMAADKKAALDLIEFVKNADLPADYDSRAARARSDARLQAITALGYTLIDQSVPEVLEFLERLTDRAYAESLKFGRGISVDRVRNRAYLALSVSGTDESLRILERHRSQAQHRKDNLIVQALSADGKSSSEAGQDINGEIELLDQHLNTMKKRRAGLSEGAQKFEEMQAIP